MSIKEKIKNLEILPIYYYAILIYLLPMISLAIFLVDQLTVNKTEMLFWVIFLVGMLPCGIIGLSLSIVGLIKSRKSKNRQNTVLGLIGTIGGLICLIGGVFGITLIYVVVI